MTCVTTATTAPRTRPERRAKGADTRSTRSSAEKNSLRPLGFASLEKPGGCLFDKMQTKEKWTVRKGKTVWVSSSAEWCGYPPRIVRSIQDAGFRFYFGSELRKMNRR